MNDNVMVNRNRSCNFSMIQFFTFFVCGLLAAEAFSSGRGLDVGKSGRLDSLARVIQSGRGPVCIWFYFCPLIRWEPNCSNLWKSARLNNL